MKPKSDEVRGTPIGPLRHELIGRLLRVEELLRDKGYLTPVRPAFLRIHADVKSMHWGRLNGQYRVVLLIRSPEDEKKYQRVALNDLNVTVSMLVAATNALRDLIHHMRNAREALRCATKDAIAKVEAIGDQLEGEE